jgi:hypothetical protein
MQAPVKITDDVGELQREVLHLRRVVEYMGWRAIAAVEQIGDNWPHELDDVISAFICEESRHENRGTMQ